MKTVLVTGAAGFIGAHTSKALLDLGYHVIGVDDLNDYYDPALKQARLEWVSHDAFHFVQQDFRDAVAMRKIFQAYAIDTVCHLGARAGVRASIENPELYRSTNVEGTAILLDLAYQFDVQQFVLASSSSVYGNTIKLPFAEDDPIDQPVSPYAETKIAAEQLLQEHHKNTEMNSIALRFFTVYGPWGRPDMAVFKFTKAIVHEQPIDVYNNGKHQRDFTYIDDIVAGILAALQKDLSFEIINLGNSHSEELLYLITCLEQAIGKKAQLNMLPQQPGDMLATYADITKAQKLLGYIPQTDLKTGITQFVDWYKRYYK